MSNLEMIGLRNCWGAGETIEVQASPEIVVMIARSQVRPLDASVWAPTRLSVGGKVREIRDSLNSNSGWIKNDPELYKVTKK